MPQPARVALVGALDTKHAEYGFVRDRLATHGVTSLLVDTGVLGTAGSTADIDRRSVAEAAGADLDALVAARDRGRAVEAMAVGAARRVARLHGEGSVSGTLVLGGSNAGYVMSRLAAMLPFGCPKLLVSTIVAGDTRPYVQTSDLAMMHPVVDLAGLNSVSAPVLARAADAMAGMVCAPPARYSAATRAVGATMFGVTTDCVTAVHDDLSTQDIETQVFHANGTGGRALERMIAGGSFAAVADVTTTELADELLGGVCSAGPDRLTAATRHGVPQVVSVGALDMANFGPADSLPERYAGRLLLAHNPAVTLVRTSPAECAVLGDTIAARLASATACTEVHIPAKGFSQVSVAGAPFHDPAADAALIDSLRAALAPHIPLYVHDLDINDATFARHLTRALHRALNSTKGT